MDLKGKTINFLGDSITEGCGVSDVEANRYDNVIKRKSRRPDMTRISVPDLSIWIKVQILSLSMVE